MNSRTVSHEALTTREVAALFHVDPRTVAKWVKKGKLATFRTPGGHLRFRRSEIAVLLETQLGQAS